MAELSDTDSEWDVDLTAELVRGLSAWKRARSLASEIETRAAVYEMSEAELRAIVLQRLFEWHQSADGPDGYSEWQDRGKAHLEAGSR